MKVRSFCQENRKLEVSMCQLDPRYNFKNVKNIESGSLFLGLRREKSIICGLYLPCLPGMFTCEICKPPLTLTWCKSKGIDCELIFYSNAQQHSSGY